MKASTVRIGEIARQIRGVTYEKSDASDHLEPGLIPILRAGNITNAGLDFGDLIYVPKRNVSDIQMVRKNDVVIAASSGSLEVVGKAAQAAVDFPGGFGAFCKVLRPSDSVDPRFFGHYFRTREYRLIVSSLAAGANINNLRNEHLDNLEIRLPPLQEQRHLARILDQADGICAKRRAGIVALNDLAQSIFLEMFGGVTDEYRAVTVGELAAEKKNSIRTGPFGSQLLHGEFVESGIPVLGIDNAVNNEFRWAKRRFITEEKYRKLSRYQVFPGDVIITIMGTCGRCAVAPEDLGVAINTKHLCCISLDRSKCLPEFLHSYFLMHPIALSYLQRAAKGAIMSGLNMNIIKAMPVALPPLAQQERYVAVARAVQDQKIRQLRHLEELEELFDSLQARAFREEL